MDEEKKESQTEENTDSTEKTGTDDSQAGGETKETKETKEKDVNWEQRYTDLQAENTKTSQENADLRRQAEERSSQQQQEEEEEELGLEGDEEGFIDRKAVNKIVKSEVQKAVSQVRTQSANAYFRRTYKDLVKHENVIAGLLRNPKNPEKLREASPEERIDAAVGEFNALTEEAKAEAKTEAEAEAKAKEKAKSEASGLGSTTTSTPAKGDEDVSDAQEIADRKARSAKKRNL